MSRADREKRIDWLLDNQRLWEGYGAVTSGVIQPRLHKAMVLAGLLSTKTTLLDVDWGGMINEARQKRRMRQPHSKHCSPAIDESPVHAPHWKG